MLRNQSNETEDNPGTGDFQTGMRPVLGEVPWCATWSRSGGRVSQRKDREHEPKCRRGSEKQGQQD